MNIRLHGIRYKLHKQTPTNMIKRRIDAEHVSASQQRIAEIAHDIFAICNEANDACDTPLSARTMKAIERSTYIYAEYVHVKNLELYRRVLRGM